MITSDTEIVGVSKFDKSNVYHTATTLEKPSLIMFLEAQIAYYEMVEGNNTTYIQAEFFTAIEPLALIIKDSLKESFNYSPDYLSLILDKVIAYEASFTFVNLLDFLEFQVFLKRLLFLKDLLTYKLAFKKYSELLSYILELIFVEKKSEGLGDIDLELYLSGGLDIHELIFSNPQPLTLEQQAKLNNLIDSSSLTYKEEYKGYADSKGTSTSPEVILLALLFFAVMISDDHSEVITTSTVINDKTLAMQTDGDSDYENLKFAKDDLVSNQDKKETTDKSYQVQSTMALMGQNSKVDNDDTNIKSAKRSLLIVNTENEQVINTDVYINNSYELEQELVTNDNKINEDLTIIDEDTANLQASATVIDGNKDLLGDETVKVQTLAEINNSNNQAGKLKQDMGILNTDLSKQTALIKATKNSNSKHTSFSPEYSDIIASRVSSLEVVTNKANATTTSAGTSSSNTSDTLSSFLAVAGGVLLVASVIEDPTKVLDTALTLLINPLEALLLIANTLICTIKALQCVTVGALLGIVDLSSDLLNLVTSVKKLELLETANLAKMEAITSKATTSLVNAVNKDIEEMLEEKITLIYPIILSNLKDDLEKASVVIDNYRIYMKAKMVQLKATTSLIDGAKALLDARALDLKASFDNLIANAESLTNVDSCKPLDMQLPSLDFMIDLKNPFQFRLPKFSMPKVDSKSVSCK